MPHPLPQPDREIVKGNRSSSTTSIVIVPALGSFLARAVTVAAYRGGPPPRHRQRHLKPRNAKDITMKPTLALLTAPLLIVFGDQAAESGPKPVSPRPAKVTVGPRELIRGRENMPFVMDSTLATLRRDQDSWFFYHTVDWGKQIEKWRGTPSNPFQARVWQKSRDEVFDLRGQYTKVHHAGLWLLNIHRMPDGNLLGVVHVELHPGEPAVNHGEQYALGLVFSQDGGDRWGYCGEIVRPQDAHGNVGGAPLLVVGDYFHVYFNDQGPSGRRAAVARAPVADVLTGSSPRLGDPVAEVQRWRLGTGRLDRVRGGRTPATGFGPGTSDRSARRCGLEPRPGQVHGDQLVLWWRRGEAVPALIGRRDPLRAAHPGRRGTRTVDALFHVPDRRRGSPNRRHERGGGRVLPPDQSQERDELRHRFALATEDHRRVPHPSRSPAGSPRE